VRIIDLRHPSNSGILPGLIGLRVAKGDWLGLVLILVFTEEAIPV